MKRPADRSLIVNADDLGESKDVNAGIIDAYRNGIVTSASLLTNMEGFKEAVDLLKATPGLDVGVHLNMHRGAPLTDVTYLASNEMFLKDPFRFALRVYRSPRRAREEIEREFEAQLVKALDAGVAVSHLDTEKHLHVLPIVFKIVLTLAKKHGISRVRLPFETPTLLTFRNPSQFYKSAVMWLCAPRNRFLLKESGLLTPDHFYGVSLSKRFSTKEVARLLRRLPRGVSELSCHPGFPSLARNNYIDAHRDAELRTLTDPNLRAAVEAEGIVLSTFSDIR